MYYPPDFAAADRALFVIFNQRGFAAQKLTGGSLPIFVGVPAANGASGLEHKTPRGKRARCVVLMAQARDRFFACCCASLIVPRFFAAMNRGAAARWIILLLRAAWQLTSATRESPAFVNC
jgi:hypothetical protein